LEKVTPQSKEDDTAFFADTKVAVATARPKSLAGHF
jgi:hypothetical protein